MNTCLINAYSTRNLGDAAIYAALSQLSPGGRVCVDLADTNPTLVAGLELKKQPKVSDTLISVGGDIFNNGRPGLITRNYLSMLKVLATDPERTFVFGQSIPPSCHGVAFSLLAHTMRELSSVVVRDERSFQLLRKAGVAAELSYDTAFSLSPSSATIKAALNEFDRRRLDPSKSVLISLRGASPLYDAQEDRTVAQLGDVVHEMYYRGHQPALVIQADCNPADSDRSQAKKLLSRFPSLPVLDPFAAQAPLAPWDVFSGYLALANSVVAVRYHAAILRLISGRLPYVLHYSNKGEDLCTRLGLPGSKLGHGDVDEIVSGIEASADEVFDPRPYAQHVTQSFAACLSRIDCRLAA